jgi:hypothetical protein
VSATIEKFLGQNARRDRVAKFEELCKGKTKEEIREIEMALLRPDAIPDYVGEVTRYNINSETTVKLVFKNETEMALIGKYLSINTYIEPCISDIKVLVDLFGAMEKGDITYNKKAGLFSFRENESNMNKNNSFEHTEKVIESVNEKNTAKSPGKNEPSPLRRFLRRG